MLVKEFNGFRLGVSNSCVSFNGCYYDTPVINAGRLADTIRDFVDMLSSADCVEALEYFSANAKSYFEELKKENLSSDFGKRQAALMIGIDWLDSIGAYETAPEDFLNFNASIIRDELCAFVSDNYSSDCHVSLSVAYDVAYLTVSHGEYGRHVFDISLCDYEKTFDFIREWAEHLA